MEITISGGVDDLHDLKEWLDGERELRGRLRLRQAGGGSGDLGTAEVLTLALGAGGAITTLAASLRVYFAQPRRSDVRIKITNPQGRVIDVDAKRTRKPEEIVREVLAAAEESDAGV